MSYCGKCGHQMPGENSFCGKCGAVIEPETPKKTCQNCHNEIDEGLVFCDKCGAKYMPSAPPPVQPQGYQPPPQYYQAPTSPPPPQYSPAQQSTFKSFVENQSLMLWGSIICGVIGVIVAISTYTFGLGEIMVFCSLGLGIASKKPAGIISGVVFMFILAIIWFGF